MSNGCNGRPRRRCSNAIITTILVVILAFLVGLLIGIILGPIGFILFPFIAVLAIAVLIMLVLNLIHSAYEPRCVCRQEDYRDFDD